jgi:hypothetical protein
MYVAWDVKVKRKSFVIKIKYKIVDNLLALDSRFHGNDVNANPLLLNNLN